MAITVDTGFSEIEADLWGEEWVDTYLETGDWHSINNEMLHRGCMLTLLGQTIPDGHFFYNSSKNHVRINPFMVQTSGTGKDPAFDFMKSIAQNAGLSFWDGDSLEESALVGKIDEDGEEIPGLAKDYDIIAFREGMNIFKSANLNWNDRLLLNINNIVDGNKVGRAMANGRVEYRPNCSILATTHIPDENDFDVEELLRNGNLSRYLFYYRSVPSDERDEINRIRAERQDSDTDYRKLSISRVDKLAATLMAIIDEMGLSPEFNTGEVSHVRLHDRVRETKEECLADLPPDIADMTGPVDSRYENHTLRVACLLAALDKCSTNVTDDHIDRALNFIEPAWQSLADFMTEHVGSSTSDDERKDLKMLVALRESDGTMTKKEVADAIGVGERSVRNYARILRESGLICVEEGGGRGYLTRYRLRK